MRASSSAGVIRPAKVSRACASRSPEKPSLRQAWRTAAAAPATSPCVSSARASAKWPLAVCGGSVRKKSMTACGSMWSCHITASARRRSASMLGQLGLAAMKRGIARKIARAVVAAQDHPFHELAGDRIGNRALDVGCFALAVLAHQIDGLFHRGQIQRRGRRCCRRSRRAGQAGRRRRYRRLTDRRLKPRIRRRRTDWNLARRRSGCRRDRKRRRSDAARASARPGFGVSALPAFRL